jgi:NAD(P)-dependent dehydrogenase (short-subunit alcohol dehydrogenase family)
MALRSILVTGANRGIGRGVVSNLVGSKAFSPIYLTSRTINKAESTASELKSEGVTLVADELDIANTESIQGFTGRLRATG